jgi:hypothetical protein
MWSITVFWEEFYSVGYSYALGRWDIAFVVPVMLWGLVDEEAVGSSVGPAGALHSSVMNNHLAARGCQWCFVEIKGSFHLGVS